MQKMLCFVLFLIMLISGVEAEIVISSMENTSFIKNMAIGVTPLRASRVNGYSSNSLLSIRNIDTGIFGSPVKTVIVSSISLNQGSIFSASTAIKPELVGSPLNYPNPFSLAAGSKIGYMLTAPMDIEIKIYSINGYLMASKQLYAITLDEGAHAGYNRVEILDILEGETLPAGIYLYLLIHNGKVIGKEKMAVLP
jgi:hypothetical protein